MRPRCFLSRRLSGQNDVLKWRDSVRWYCCGIICRAERLARGQELDAVRCRNYDRASALGEISVLLDPNNAECPKPLKSDLLALLQVFSNGRTDGREEPACILFR